MMKMKQKRIYKKKSLIQKLMVGLRKKRMMMRMNQIRSLHLILIMS